MAVDISRYKIKMQGGNEYVMVAGRLMLAHEDNERLSIKTEVVLTSDEEVVFRAEVSTDKGVFTGTARSDKMHGSPQERKTPWEVAETSAIGRALGFAGYTLENGIASAEEMQQVEGQAQAQTEQPQSPPQSNGRTGGNVPSASNGPMASEAQKGAIFGAGMGAGYTAQQLRDQVQARYGRGVDELTKAEASHVIEKLKERQATNGPADDDGGGGGDYEPPMIELDMDEGEREMAAMAGVPSGGRR